MAAKTATVDVNEGSRQNRGNVGKAAGIMVATVLLSRVLGMIRDIVIAHEFGRSLHTDAYTAAFKIPDLLMYLVAGGAISSTFIPVFTEYLHRDDEKGAWEVFSTVITTVAIVSAFFVIIAEIFTPGLVHFLNPGYTQDKINETIPLTRIVLPAQFCFMVGSLYMATLNSRNQMLIPALGPSVYNIGIIVGAIMAGLMPDRIGAFSGLKPLMWGALGGAFVGNLLMQAIAAQFKGMRYRPALNLNHEGVVKVGKMMIPILLGISLPNVDQIVGSYFASMLGTGGQTALTYANRLMLIPIGVFAQAMSIAILPTMARHAAAGAMRDFKETTGKGLRTILFLTVPASVLMFVLAEPIIQLLYQGGHFHAGDTSVTAAALRFYSVGIFAWSCQAILTRSFYAMQDTWTTVKTGTIMTLVFVGMNALATWFVGGRPIRYVDGVVVPSGVPIHTIFGVEGIALSTTLAATMYMVVLFIILRRRLGGVQDRKLTISTVRILLGSAVMSVLAWALMHGFSLILGPVGSDHVKLRALVELLVCSSAGMAGFVGVAKYYRMEELSSVTGMVGSKLGPLLAKLKRKGATA